MGIPVQMLAQNFADDELELRPELAVAAEAPTREESETELAAAPAEQEWAGRFAEMAERQAQFMFRVAHGLLRNVQDAEDAVQEALLKLYRGDGWRGMEDERAFLARTVWRVGLDLMARRPRLTESLEDEAGREFRAAGETAEQTLVGHGQRELLRLLIEGLPEELRQPLVLSAVEEMTSREVAVAMGIPEGTVRTRVMRARAELRRRFEGMRNR
jgi:RNA polymerase sigma-70 factor (ECF subfamily)